MDIANEQSAEKWPTTGRLKNTPLVFSGTFDQQRIGQQNTRKIIRWAEKAMLSAIIILGLAGLAMGAVSGFQQAQWDFLLNHSVYNLAFWVAVFVAAYFWAQIKQGQDKQQMLNLMLLEEPDAGAESPKELDVYTLFNSAAKTCWDRAFLLAKAQSQKSPEAPAISAINLLLALLEDKSIQMAFYRLSVDPRDMKMFCGNYSLLKKDFDTNEISNIPFTAFAAALKLQNKTIDPLMLLCALKIELPQRHILQDIFFNIDISTEDLETVCAWQFNIRFLAEEINWVRKLSKFKPGSGINRGLTAVPTGYLDRFSRDLTLAAKYGSLPLSYGRRRDLQEVFKLISTGKKNLLLKSGSGTGRTALLAELAYKMAAEQVPKALADMRLIKLELEAVLGNPQRAEQVLMQVLNEADRSDNIILVIPEIQELAKAETGSGISLLEILLDFLENHKLAIFATTTNEDYTDYLRKFPSFDQIFTGYELKKLNRGDILLACCVRASILEARNKCFFRYTAIKKAVELSDLYIKDKNQPQKTIGILVEAASRAKSSSNHVVSLELVETIVSEKTHIPSQNLNQDESAKLLSLEEDLGKYIVGQREALVAVAEGLRRARSGLASETRPLGSFLFLGPTGVGKTEVAKTLAKVYFGEEKFLLRLDMSEYQGHEGLDKLIGDPKIKADSPLVKHLKNYPFCLLLLDEFEKAGPEVLNLFLQILEDGRLTSGQGETVDLTHCLIIATSNAGSSDIQAGLKAGQSIDHIKALLLDELLLKYYRPELLNRFDGVILFSPLSPQEIAAIVQLQLNVLRLQLLAKGIKIQFAPAVAQDIAQKAYEPSLGARPIRRYIQDHLETFVAKLILQKSVERGTELVIDLKDGQLVIV